MTAQLTGPVRVRFAPSPTGDTHLGGGRTALYNYLLARQTGGQFILRIEDTDQKRYVPEAEQELLTSLRWLGLEWDEGPDTGGPYAPYRQSERKVIYQEHAHELVEKGFAYPCFCAPERLEQVRQEQRRRKDPVMYDGLCRVIPPQEAAARVAAGESHVIRFRMPHEGSITVRDYLRGEITVENRQLDDFILIKSDGLAVYHLAAMVDDHIMGITHVLRTSEWLPTLPLHAHIIRAFGWKEPVFVHPSIFLKPSGRGKMSKRETEALKAEGHSIFIKDLKDQGYVPEAVVNWIALMGWSYDDHTEFFTMDDLIANFSLDKLNPAPAAIDFKKFDHFNGLHIRRLETGDLAERLRPFFIEAGYEVDDQILQKVAPLVQPRITTLRDAPDIAGFFFYEQVEPNVEDLVAKKLSPSESANAARRAYLLLDKLPDFSHESAEAPLRTLADELGLKAGQLFSILRVAVTGQKVSPPLFESMEVIGREKSLQRLKEAIELLEELAGG